MDEREFRDDVINRLARIETHAKASENHEPRISALERFKARVYGACLGVPLLGLVVAYFVKGS